VLREAILTGRYEPGKHLGERTVGAELGVSGIAGIIDQMCAAARDGDAEAFFHLDNRFHEAFWRVAGSETLLGLAANLRGRIAHFLRRASYSLGRDGLDWSAGVHQDWLDGVANGDVADAQAEVERQIVSTYERIVSAMTSEEADAVR
jgi:DNA-binding GntR family transcriptional regulator